MTTLCGNNQTTEKFLSKSALPYIMPNKNSPSLSTSQNSSIKLPNRVIHKNDDEQYVSIHTLYTLNMTDDSIDSIDSVEDLVKEDNYNLKKINMNTLLDQSVEIKFTEEEEKEDKIHDNDNENNNNNQRYYDTITTTFSVEEEMCVDSNIRQLKSQMQLVNNLIPKKFFM